MTAAELKTIEAQLKGSDETLSATARDVIRKLLAHVRQLDQEVYEAERATFCSKCGDDQCKVLCRDCIDEERD